MEALRKQLADVQGYLTERDRKYRAMHQEKLSNEEAFRQQVKDLTARNEELATKNDRLKAENDQLRRSVNSNGGDDKMILTRHQRDQLEYRFQKANSDLSAKTKLCAALQLQIEQLERERGVVAVPGTPATPSTPTPAPNNVALSLIPAPASPGVAESHVVALFTTLRERIRGVSRTRFSDSTPVDRIPESSRDELDQLSGKWRTYYAKKLDAPTNNNNNNGNHANDVNGGSGSIMVSYLMRALIWRYVHSALFMKPGRVWGQDARSALRVLGMLLAPPGLPEAEYQAWRTGTGALLHKASCGSADAGVIDVVTRQILDATRHFVAGGESPDQLQRQLAHDLREIVAVAADLAAIFARSGYETIMADKPDSTLTRGFAFHEPVMEIKARVGAAMDGVPPIVDMMITPCLFRKSDNGEYTVISKAQVVC